MWERWKSANRQVKYTLMGQPANINLRFIEGVPQKLITNEATL